MNRKQAISSGTDKMQSVNRNAFRQVGELEKTVSFMPRKSGHITPGDDDWISMERRRKYQYYEKE